MARETTLLHPESEMRFEIYASFGDDFVGEFSWALGLEDDVELAARVLRALLEGLRTRISLRASTCLLDHLPLLIKAMYVDGWDLEENAAADDIGLAVFISLPPLSSALNVSGSEALAALFLVLERHMGGAELRRLREALPRAFAPLIVSRS